jgi:predicted dehydrogenase
MKLRNTSDLSPVQLMWHGSWMHAPGYQVPAHSVLIEVEATLPLLRLENASARPARQPGRKVAVFLMTDGPRSTIRKARTKRNEPTFTGDFRVAVIIGHEITSRKRVAALATRVPPAAQQLPVHHRLVREVDTSFSKENLARIAASLLGDPRLGGPLSRQNYLYSGMEPPHELIELWEGALDTSRHLKPLSASLLSRLITPPIGSPTPADTVMRLGGSWKPSGLPVALLGAGDYARTEVIPAIRTAGFSPHYIADRAPQIAALVGHEHDFRLATTDAERAIAELPRPGLVIVATAHDSHARLACLAAEAGHHVFVEKPPTVTRDDVTRLAKVMLTRPGIVEIGFNRRYHPLVRRAQKYLSHEHGPTSITCTVKELEFQPDHWYFWPNQGTRFTGNLCHWIDLAVFLLDGRPLPVTLTLSPRIPSSKSDDEERVVTVTFDDGSLLTILGTTRGDDIRGVQEQIDIRRGRTSITIDDLWKLRVRSGGIERYSRTVFRNKAHSRMYAEVFARIVRGEPATYPVGDMLMVSAIQIAASDLVTSQSRVGEIPDWLAPALRAAQNTHSGLLQSRHSDS